MKHIKRKFLVLVTFITLLSYTNLKAQSGAHMGIHVGNHLNCSITFDWYAKPLNGCAAANCASGTGIVVPATVVYNFASIGTGGACSTFDFEACVIVITITKIGTTTVSIVASTTGPAGPQAVGNLAPGCTSSTTNYVSGTNGLDIQN